MSRDYCAYCERVGCEGDCPESTAPEVTPVFDAPVCQHDTDGDGNCGMPTCPACGKHNFPTKGRAVSEEQLKLGVVVSEMQRKDLFKQQAEDLLEQLMGSKRASEGEADKT